MALTATMCGANGWADVERFVDARYDWFEKYIPMESGIPSHDTFGRIFAKLDTGEFLSAMHGWADEFAGSPGQCSSGGPVCNLWVWLFGSEQSAKSTNWRRQSPAQMDLPTMRIGSTRWSAGTATLFFGAKF